MTKKNIISTIIFLFIFIQGINGLGEVFRNKDNAEVIYTFKDEGENTLDVLFIGASTCYRFFSPQELWNSYGITSYNLGTSEQSLSESYFVLKYALDKQSPELVVMDVSSMITYPLPLSDARTHAIMDNLEINSRWIEACNVLVSQNKQIEYFVPLFAYHKRWKELKEKDFKPIVSDTKGTAYNYVIEPFENIQLVDTAYTREIEDESLKWIYKISNLCKENEIKLLFTINPIPSLSAETEEGKKRQGMHNALEEFAKGEGVDILNMTRLIDEIGLDMKKDYSDKNHVNVVGAIKITNYLGDFLIEKYQLRDHREEEISECWNESYSRYLEEILERICKSKSTEKQKEYFSSYFMR